MLEIERLNVTYRSRAGAIRAVCDVDLSVPVGETVGLVGESGCGKSTAGRALLALTPVTDGEIVLEFPESDAEPMFVRPRELALACLLWWILAAGFLGNAAGFAVLGASAMPLGLMASAPAPYLAGFALFGIVHVALGLALWSMRPWSRRPARLVAGFTALWALLAVPWGLLIAGLEVGILVYLGTPDPSGLVRRAGWLAPTTRFTITRRGILEGRPIAQEATRFERIVIGPRVVRTTGFSWVLRQLRSKVQMVYQDPHAALNPALTLGEQLEHAIEVHLSVTGRGTGSARDRREEIVQEALRLLDDVGLRPPEKFYRVLGTDISGGQKQRAVVARALAPRPLLLVADEPVAMLDMSIRAKVLELLLDLKRKYGLTYVFITHDLATAKLVCDRIGIMYLGRIVEMGDARRIYADPKHPYTRALLHAIPVPDPAKRTRRVLPKGEVPDAVFPPAGCRFHPRCPVALPTCGWEGRDLIDHLEERRTDPARLAEEEAAFGTIAAWRADGLVAARAVGKDNPEAFVARVRSAIAEAPEAMARAVEDVRLEDGEVVVRFRPPDPLGPKEIEGRVVECLLY